MREFQEKKRFRKYLYSRVTVAILFILILIALHSVWGVWQKEKQSAANAYEADRELSKLEDRQNLLNTEIGKLNTDEGIEEAIRKKFGVSKPGEQMIVIVNDNSTTTPLPATTTSFWGKIKNWFK